jgi:S1-C subfamily serine protease
VTTDQRPPAEVYRAVQLRPHSGGAGWAAPIGPGQLLTVKHLAEGDATWVSRDGTTGPAVPVWKSEDRDLAIFKAEDETNALMPTMSISDEDPREQELLWFRYFVMPGGVVAVGRAYYIATDSEGDYHLDGAGYPGASGSPVVNSRGKTVAFVASGFNQSGTFNPGMDLQTILHLLAKKVTFRGAIIAEPVVRKKGLPK